MFRSGDSVLQLMMAEASPLPGGIRKNGETVGEPHHRGVGCHEQGSKGTRMGAGTSLLGC